MVRKRFLLGRVERERVALRVERGDAQPLGPSRYRRRCSELDAHLAKDAHSAIADRLEQAAGGGVEFVHAVLDPACAAGRRITLERGREQLPDPAPVRSGMHITLGAP